MSSPDPAANAPNLDEVLDLIPIVAPEPDPTFDKWLRWVERIRDDLSDLRLRRYVWSEYTKMLAANSAIEASVFFYVEALSFRDALTVGIRRQCWGEDPHSLSMLLKDMAERPELLSRARYVSMFEWGMQNLGHAAFDSWAGEGVDQFPVHALKSDAASLKQAVTRIADHVNKTRAHPRWSPADVRVQIDLSDIDRALDEAERTFLEYYTLLTGRSIVQLAPEIQYDWMAPFRRPWMPHDRSDVAAVAWRVRRVLEEWPWRPETRRGFPRGACGDASRLLGLYLEGHGFGEWTQMMGREPTGESTHAWLEQDGLIVDITADQFDDVDDPVIMTTDRAWHDRRFPVEEVRSMALAPGDQLLVEYRHLVDALDQTADVKAPVEPAEEQLEADVKLAPGNEAS